MNKVFVWIVAAVVVIAGFYWFMGRTAGESPRSVTVSLYEQSASGMSGLATLTESDGMTVVALALTGTPQGIAQPAHIHAGSCANIGGVVYPLTFPVNGASETTLGVSLDALLAEFPLAINVHKSPEEAGVYIACGDMGV